MSAKAWWLIIATVTAWGITPIIEKRVLQGTDITAGMTLRSWISAIFLTSVLIATGKGAAVSQLTRNQMLAYGASGLLGGTIGLFFYFSALKVAPASKVVPLSATFPMITFVLSAIFLGEPLTLKALLGVAFVIIGAVLLS